MSALERRLEALEARNGSIDPFAHLDDEELERFCEIVTEFYRGDADTAQAEWNSLSDALRRKFTRTIELDRLAQCGGLH